MRTNAGNLKKGDFVYYQGEVWQVQKADFYSPGKGSALMKAKIKNLLSGKNIEYAYKSNEQVDVLNVESIEMQYLYKDNENIYLMNERTYNQFTVPLSVVGEVANFLKEGTKLYVYLHNDKPLTIRPPMSVKLKVVEAEMAVKGDTVSGAKKPVVVETGVTVMVPLFVKVGETVIINPETGEYTGRE
ncbi:elongation factor P [Candidatus Roizmanbacteria bacterium CG22_combo_CG10-13_8_21_14_all_35_9]|uniref:Elongation factor P n=4 Tax=Candidatus Roizmaniibacteriota TaxID=1752723 RepID=A0A2M8F3B5_9BACT|nr:MAG: elongation factor P [Candidatus Roizmanbacteria bacterium CG23_combo_of_CG06-09_8_20_14_all_35_49]PIP62337.1 MAG: elongation factor P [Candidatus Roizmanbacteria bacterium CG22_combo_CG10-13_8_21_14_all_35_9]PIY71251.1 MAG: elongation factor P [Candidatus Roizmanbacteria bacterium CG_4_10_14_0_8_um_filter_35_28]PJC33786.1 MAG: elongation factor P [Candidatus Roizmanbacteria bacterium CG_4_9_14_0_2_um_filter_35_15]PJC84141.1 MAG: elongation factor P [Candidatus Roizmanbacteria bacterium 